MKILIFSGTTEGRYLAEFLKKHGVIPKVFVATTYGEAVMASDDQVIQGRLCAKQMAMYMEKESLVIDATHPYAVQVTKEIQQACTHVGATYMRLLRPSSCYHTGANIVTVSSTEEAITWLNTRNENVLLTIGSKELEAYTKVQNYQTRLFPRVLPTADVLRTCEHLGFQGKSILAMQGPFSHAMNVALLQKTQASILVTKDTGLTGGFAEKLSAAEEVGATVLVIARPVQEEGYSLEEMKAWLSSRLHLHTFAKFPLFVSLAGKSVVVAGAGKIAQRRIHVLKQFGAEVTVIAPEWKQNVRQDVLWIAREIRLPEDIEKATLVIAATADRGVNHAIAQYCKQLQIPVSIADCAAECTFYFPAICQGNGFTAGVVSDGTQHHQVAEYAKKIREVLQDADCKSGESR